MRLIYLAQKSSQLHISTHAENSLERCRPLLQFHAMYVGTAETLLRAIAFSASGSEPWARTRRFSLMRKDPRRKLHRQRRVEMGRIATYLPPGRVHLLPRPRLRQMWMSLKDWRQTARQDRLEVRPVRFPNLTEVFFHRTAQPQHGHGNIPYLRLTLLTSLIPQSLFRSHRLLVRSKSRQLATSLLHLWSRSTFLRPVRSFEDTHSRHHMQTTIVEQPPEESIATVTDSM
jgi:hypothetical protein